MSLSRAVQEGVRAQAIGAQVGETDPDFVLVQRVQAGDVQAFDILTRKYRERLYSVIYNLTSNSEDAADLTQDALIKAFTSIGNFKGRSSFFTWLYRIAVNTTLTYIKRNKLRRFFSLEAMDDSAATSEAFAILSQRHGSDKAALLGELQEKLNDALQKLSPKHRTVVVLFEVEGLGHQEIADIMKCSVGTVRSRLHYAKQQLQSHLQDYLK